MKRFVVEDERFAEERHFVEVFRGTGAAGIIFGKLDAEDGKKWYCWLSPKSARKIGKAMAEMAEKYEAELEGQWDIYQAE